MGREKELLRILRIGHATSVRGESISLKEALSKPHYCELRPNFDSEDLVPLIQKQRKLIEEWWSYSEDKRTSGGWYLTRGGEVGRNDNCEERMQYGSPGQAVANYVVRELDFWARICEGD